jgi:glycosyltransferase involved in cell wall biosynthesis
VRFLWQSNAPWYHTGYGQQTMMMCRSLLELGHEPTCFAFCGLEGGKIVWDGYPIVPKGFDSWGNDIIKAHTEQQHSELLITLMDLFVLDSRYGDLSVPWAAWTPLDSVGIGRTQLESLKRVTHPIAMSDFGVEQMRNYEVEPFARIYHAVDTEIFKPMDKWECRSSMELPADAYIVGMVMANKGDRKQYPMQLTAVKRWMDEYHKDDDIRVFLHTERTDLMQGWNMVELVDMVGLKGKVFSPNQYNTTVVPWEQDMMAKLYNSFDVLMNVTAGEGFGIPIIEAQACGVPVLTHNVTAMPEITHYGYTVEPANMGLAGHYGWQFAPDIDDMVQKLENVYRMSSKTQAMETVELIKQRYDVRVIALEWDDVIRAIEQELEGSSSQARMVIS